VKSPFVSAFLAALLWCAAPLPALSQAPEPQPIISGWARALPSLARNGMVASQERTASLIGVEILKAGGNAVDAAVAVGFALAVTLPRAGNIGGGGFMLLRLAGPAKTVAIDYRETAPADTPKDVFLDEKGEFVPSKSQSSGLAVGVPGTVAGFELAHRKYGSGKLTFAELIEPAIRLAREGIEVEDDLADSLPFVARRLARYPSSRAIFLKGQEPLQRGDRLVQTDLAASLDRVAQNGPRGFYEGETAEKLIAAIRAHGGRMTLDDLRAYRVREREPVRGAFRGREIVSMPPPSAGGVLIVQMLNVLEGLPMKDLGHNSAAVIHRMAETMKHAYADRAEHMGDPDFVTMPLKALQSRAYAEKIRSLLTLDRATPSAQFTKARTPRISRWWTRTATWSR